MLEAINPALFPRDSDLIRSQARLTLADDVIGPVGRITGLSLPHLFVILQVVALSLLVLAAFSIGRVFYRTGWAAVALVAALSLRHAISKSGTNTLEGYFHPRQLSFAIGAFAIAGFLRGRYAVMAALLALAGALHPTTGLWLTLWMGVAIVVAERGQPRKLRIPLGVAAVALTIVAVGALTSGPLAGRLIVMDNEWLATLTSKDYLFPLDWPAVTWIVNLAYAPVILLIYRRRRDLGLAVDREGALVAGCLSLLGIFALALPFNAARVALAIQLQPARIFWMLDFLAVIYVVWAIAEGSRANESRARVAAAAIALIALVRGSYVMFVEFPERRIVQANVPDDDWGRAMAWARATDVGSGWLADPAHAVRYGTSVRVAAERDVFVEAIKDAAVGMYDRSVALRTRDRVAEIGDFSSLTPASARTLAHRYGLDYLVTEQDLALPLAFRSGRLAIYRLR
jgi:hypothetical protein